jgi:predicted phage terminase large subunit-like protein
LKPEITETVAAAMMLSRRKAQESLTEYARFIDIPGVPLPDIDPDHNNPDAWTEDEHGRLGAEIDAVLDTDLKPIETQLADHHILVLETCQGLVDNTLLYYEDADGEVWPYQGSGNRKVCKRAMLMLPPGSAKSTYGSVVFPTWEMGRKSGQEIILTGYGDVICKRHGKRARQVCASSAYRAVFGFNVDPTTRAADNWETANKSSYKSAGILSGITGFRCDGLIWDDITKGRKEADSVTIREDTWNAYIDDARSRKKPQAWELGIGTRWHEDETMGRILPEGYAGESGYLRGRDGNVWYVLCLPAQCEREDDVLGRSLGEYIWPEWFGSDFWRDKKVNPRSWASLYQQRPALEEGLYFKREWFRTYNDLPTDINKYISFDPAVTAEEDDHNSDQTALQVWAIDTNAKIYLIDEWVQRTTMDVWISQLITWVAIHKPLAVISESGVIRRASEPYIQREMRETGHYALFEWMSRHSDKSAMARSAQAMMAAGNVYFPATSVGDNTVDELLRFPAGKNDHRVDAFANLCLYLELLWSASPPGPKKKEPGELEHGLKISDIMPPRYGKRKSRWK